MGAFFRCEALVYGGLSGHPTTVAIHTEDQCIVGVFLPIYFWEREYVDAYTDEGCWGNGCHFVPSFDGPVGVFAGLTDHTTSFYLGGHFSD